MENIKMHMISLHEVFDLEGKTFELSDRDEAKTRFELLDQIRLKINAYNNHIRQYAYKQAVQALMDRGIIFEPVERDSVANKWDACFDSLVSEEAKLSARHYSDQFRWHLFSFELLTAVKEDEARKVFDEMKKDAFYLFFEYSEEAYLVKNAHLLTAGDAEALCEHAFDKSDIYFFSPVDKWTFVRTHEKNIGPYFFKVD